MDCLSIFVKHQQHPDSPFDLLPDDVIRIIFNKVQDAKTLIASFSLNKRLAFFIPQTETISISLNLPAKQKDNNKGNYSNERRDNENYPGGNFINMVESAANYIFTKLLSYNNNNNNSCNDDSDCNLVVILCQRLRPFSQIKHLLLELHIDVKEVHYDLLKWKANYGREFKSFDMLFCEVSLCNFSAGEWLPDDPRGELLYLEREQQRMTLTLGMRAASERHRLVRDMLPFFPTLETVTITDALRQGRLSMAERDVRELRESLKEECVTNCVEVEELSLAMNRWYAMRKWHARLLELPSLKCTWKDAIMLVVHPVEGNLRMLQEMDPVHSARMVPIVKVDEVGDSYECDAKERTMFEEAQRKILTSSEGIKQTWEWVRRDFCRNGFVSRRE